MASKTIISSYLNKNTDQPGIDNLNKFIGFNNNVYLDPAINGYAFVFITKPSLFIYPYRVEPMDEYEPAYLNMTKDPQFTMYLASETANQSDLSIVKQLSYAPFNDVESLFLPIFTNNTKTFNPSDITMDSTPMFTTRNGFNISMPTTKISSITSGSLSLSVSETQNMDFMKIITLWVEYISNITLGTFSANPEMIKNNMLDYTSSIYYFVVGPDGRTLKYWSKYTGCWPTSIPYSALGFNKGSSDKIEYDIPFQYTLKDDMNPEILEEFNMLSLHLVTPTFTAEAYDSFLQETETARTLDYRSFSTTTLLSKEGLAKYISGEKSRDPIIFYEKTQSDNILADATSGHYILSFSEDSLANGLLNNLTESNTNYNYEELVDKI